MLKNLTSIKNSELKNTAFTHRSYLNENPQKGLSSNERLEFLGDSILSFVVSDYLYKNFTHLPEGDLTNLRALLVQAKTLGTISSDLGFGAHLRMSKGEADGGGRKNNTILANTYEAVIGALFLDQGLAEVSKFIQKTLLIKIPQILEKDSFKDDKSLLQELVQEKRLPAPIYKILKSEGPDHAKIFTVGVYIDDKLSAQGSGRSKNEAEKQAAQKALAVFKK
ncbi:ribonuclease III [Candidatus Microgenomates bacterium]|nr:ribonuclease III [Candidatus Microgenomates bacterium]